MKVDVRINYSGVSELLNSTEMKNYLEDTASNIANRCGEGYNYDVKSMGTRVIASVYTETDQAKKDNADNNTIMKNLRSGL